MRASGQHRTGNERRGGAAVVELAVCLPVFMLIVLASMEACSMVFLRQAITAAAYEGARTGARHSGTTADTRTRCTQILTVRNVRGTQITLNPATIETLARGTPFRVTVTARCDANAIGPAPFFRGRTLSASVTMAKE